MRKERREMTRKERRRDVKEEGRQESSLVLVN
jgi:hypothetical protein